MIRNIVRFLPVALTVGLLAACGGAGETSADREVAGIPGTPATTVEQEAASPLPQVAVPKGAVRVESIGDKAGPAPVRVDGDRVLHGTLKISRDGDIPVAGVRIGNYRGQSDGNLFLKLCRSQDCREFEASVVGSKDNDYLLFDLQPAISVAAGDEFRFEIRRSAGTRKPVAIWTYDPTDDAVAVLAADGAQPPRAAGLVLYYQAP